MTYYKIPNNEFSEQFTGDMPDMDAVSHREALGISRVVGQGMHTVEQKFPLQCAEFKSILDGLYNMHLDKNADYSPYNILATGEVGVLTRIWDKAARLMSLGGFDIATGKYTSPRVAKNESVEDNLSDLAAYCIIEKIRRKGKWGK